jgi:hypothetical protein
MLEAWLYCVSWLCPGRSERYVFERKRMTICLERMTMLVARQMMVVQRKVESTVKAATRNDAADAEASMCSDPKPLER